MSLLAKAGGAFAQGVKTPVPYVGRAGSVLNNYLQREDPEALMRAYGSVGTLFAIVEAISTAVSAAEWKLFRKAKTLDGERTEVARHLVLDTLNAPNPFYTRRLLMEACQQHSELVGERVIVLGRIGNSPPLEMWPVRPDRVRPVPHPTEFISGYVYTGPNGEKIPLEIDEVLTTRRPNPLDPYRGLGVVQSLLVDLDATKYSADWNRNFFLNSAEPGGIVEIDHEVDDEEFRRLVSRWRDNHQGTSKAHRVAVLEAGQKWVDRKYTMRDMQFAELRSVSREVIREGFRFPKPMLGTVEDVNRANAEAAEVVFGRWLVRPRLDDWRSLFNTFLLPMYGDPTLELDYCLEIPDDMAAAAAELSSKTSAASTFISLGFDPEDVLAKLDLPAFDLAPEPEPEPAEEPAPAEGEDGANTPKGRQLTVAETAQKLYLATEGGVLLTTMEARDVLRSVGAEIEGDLPEPEPEEESAGAPEEDDPKAPPEPGQEDEDGQRLNPPPPPPGARALALDAVLTEIHGARREPPLDPADAPDLSGLQVAWEDAVTTLVQKFGPVRARWFGNLVDQVETAISDGNLAALGAIRVSESMVDDAVGATVEAMLELARDAADAVAAEAQSQGTTLEPATPDRDRLTTVASVAAALLAAGYALSAAGEALRVAGPGAAAREIGKAVRGFLDGLTDAEPERVFGGALTGAQNAGRIDTMKSGPTGAVYASEVMDANTCKPCAEIDGRWLGNTDDLERIERTYPGGAYGGYVGCEGRARCRGTVVGVWRQGSE